MSYLPLFRTTPLMVNLVAETVEVVKAFDADPAFVPSPTIRRANQIRSVHSSTWIEGNALTLDEVTAVIDGKRVVASEQEILEVKQAFEAYDAISEMDPCSLDDLLKAHGIMMDGLVRNAGRLRDVEVGVYSGATLIHAGVPAAELPRAMEELFDWLRTSGDHPLIKGCFFHCAFEGIHPFADGNGRTGRLWHSLINRDWRPLLAWIPVESVVAENQREYYRVLGLSNGGDATAFIEFMLEMVRDALTDAFIRMEEGEVDSVDVGETVEDVGENVGEDVGESLTDQVLAILREAPQSSARSIAGRLGVTSRHIERQLAALKRKGAIERVGAARGGFWKVND